MVEPAKESYTVERIKDIIAWTKATTAKKKEVKPQDGNRKNRKSEDASLTLTDTNNQVNNPRHEAATMTTANTADVALFNEGNVTSPKKSLQEQVSELQHHASLKQIETTTAEHSFQGNVKIINILQTAHAEVHKAAMKKEDEEFRTKYKEMQTQIEEKRRRVMEKLDAAWDTEGKVDSDLTSGLLQQAVLLLRRETPVLEESVRRLVDFEQEEEEEDANDISLIDTNDVNGTYQLASRVVHDSGDELEIYEHCD